MNHEDRLHKVSSDQDSQTKSKKVVGHSLKLVLRKIDKVFTHYYQFSQPICCTLFYNIY